MECKAYMANKQKLLEEDLIETLWNVKLLAEIDFVNCKGDLIETLWNVKIRSRPVPLRLRPGFNRDIVECKGCRVMRLIL